MSIYTDENRKTTANLIAEFGTEIQLRRKGEQVRTAAGGIRRVDDAIDLAPVIRYFGSVSGNPVVITTLNGQRIAAGYVLIGEQGDDIQEDDEFTVNGEDYRVFKIDPVTSEYQRKGWVDRRG